MDTKFTLTIPKPCTENWDNMSQETNGKFCSSCVKSVVDFTAMDAAGIQEYFIQNQGKKICGRFQSVQIDTLVIRIPEYALYTQQNFHKMFFLALLLAMGTTLFSCSDKAGNKQKIDKVEIVKDSTGNHTVLLGAPVYSPDDSLGVLKPMKTVDRQISNKLTKNKKPTIIVAPISSTIMGDVAPVVTKDSVQPEPIINPDRIPKTTTSEK